MNTPNLTPLRSPVGQLAKSAIIAPKTNENKAFPVGRHLDKTPHTSARTHKSVPAPDLATQKASKNIDLNAMLHLNKLFAVLLPNLKVCYHNPLYVQQIEKNYTEQESAIFLQFVKTFAQFRHQCHGHNQQSSIILTNESDFLTAFKLMKARKVAEYADVKPKNKNKVLDLLKLKFQQRTFSPQILAKELFYNYKLLDKIITLLLLEQKIEFVKEISGQHTYRLRQKSVLHVVSE